LFKIPLLKRNILSQEFWEIENYDLIICKNTLHHLSKSDQLSILKKLVRAGKNVIIIEIENPLKYSFVSFIWNFYYRKFLKDDGVDFIDDENFHNLLKKAKNKVPCMKTFLASLKTIKGNYLFALIENYKKRAINNN